MRRELRGSVIRTFAAAILTSPEIPRYTDAVEAPRAITPPRATAPGADAFGAGLARGLQDVAKVGAEIAKDERDKVVRTMTIEGKTKVDQTEVDLLYDPKAGALTRKGKDSFNIVDPTLKAYDERVADILKNTPAEESRQALQLAAAQRRVEVEKQLQRHVSGEMQTYAAAAAKAGLESTLNNVATQYQDPERVEQERKFGLGIIMSDPENKALPPEAIKLKVATWDSYVHKAVIDRKMVENPVAAQEYFEANKDRLLPMDQVKIEHALKPLVKEVEVNAAADEAFRMNPTASRAELVSSIREKHKGKPWLQEAEAEVRKLYDDREAAAKKVKEDAESAVYSYLVQVKLEGRTPKRSDVPGEVWAQLAKVDPERAGKIADEIRSSQEHATDRVRQERDRVETKSTLESITTWGMLKGNPEILRVTNLDKLLGAGKITKSHYQDLVGDQLAIKQGKGEREAKLLSDKAAVDLVLSAAGVNDKKHPERTAKFYDALNGRMKLFEAENNRPPKQEEVKNMARGLLGEVSQDVNFWPVDKTVRAFEADPAKVRVPAADRAAIKKKLEARGRQATEEAISAIYIEAKTRGGK